MPDPGREGYSGTTVENPGLKRREIGAAVGKWDCDTGEVTAHVEGKERLPRGGMALEGCERQRQDARFDAVDVQAWHGTRVHGLEHLAEIDPIAGRADVANEQAEALEPAMDLRERDAHGRLGRDRGIDGGGAAVRYRHRAERERHVFER